MTKNARHLIDGNTITVSPISEPPADVVQAFHNADKLFIDTETTGFSPWRNELALIQIYDPMSKHCLLGRVPEHWVPDPWFADLFTPSKEFIGHNISQFDIPFLAVNGLKWQNSRYFDTLVGETVIATSARSNVSKSLRASLKRRTGMIIDKTIEHGHWRSEDLTNEQIAYGASDVLVLPALYDAHKQKAEDTGQSKALQSEMDVLPMFASMNINGLPIDMPTLDKYMDEQRIRMKKSEVLLNKKLGEINYNSPIQLRRALNEIGIDLDSTAKDVLIDIILFDPDSENAQLLQAILDWRAPNKRTEMYGSSEWIAEHVQPDSRVHASFWQVGAVTTRVSCGDPNLQQVPKDGRFVFGHVYGYVIVSVDYSQVEVRIAADIGRDQVLIELLEADDVHRMIASQVFRCNPRDVTPKQRKLSKAMVFTLLFGGSWKRFYSYARHNGSDITEEESQELFARFFNVFRGLWSMRQKAYALCRTRRTAVITLPNGARRVLAGREMSPSIILNTPVQGTAAVGMKLGLYEAFKKGLGCYAGAVVHDEIVACVPEKEGEDYAHEMHKALVDGMQSVVKNCPIRAEIARLPDGRLPDYWMA